MTDLRSLTIVFENCERLEILGVNIGSLYIDEITKYYYKFPGTSDIKQGNQANRIHFSVTNFKEKVESRLLKYQDITSVKVNYYQKDSESFSVKWGYGSPCDENTKQFYQYFGYDLNIYIGYDKEEMGIE